MQSNNPLDVVRGFLSDISTKLINPAIQRGTVTPQQRQQQGQVFRQNTANVIKKGIPFPQQTIPIVKAIAANTQKTYQPQVDIFNKQLIGVPLSKEETKTKRDFLENIAFGATSAPEVSGTSKYLEELAKNQSLAKEGSSAVSKVSGKVGNFLNDIKAKIVDSTAPIEDILGQAEKKGKFTVRPINDIRLQIDRVLRSSNLAGQFAKDNGLVNVIREAPDLNALNQYMIAKQAGNVEKFGIQTGRDLTKDQQLIKDLSPQYEQFAQQVNQYTRKLLDYSVKTGLVSQDLATELVQKYPEYVPLNRIFNDLEKANISSTGSKAVASLSKQSVVQRLEGSVRDIANPLESILSKTSDAFSQGERNVAARQLASYAQLPGFEGLIKEVTGSSPIHSFSFLDNGMKKVFETTPELAAAAKSLDVQQIGLLGKIFRTPTRILQMGATGLNLPFTVTNVAKDQLTAFINSDKAAATSLLNPLNFGKALFEAVGHGQLYDEVVRSAAGGTSFDIARDAPNLTVDALRAGKSLGSKIKYTVKNPSELLRTVEDLIGRGEELTRIQQYGGTKNALLAKGRTVEDATLLAAKAARNNTANFARKGEWGKVLNAVIPFFNAGVQGARQLVRSFAEHPTATTAKLGVSLFLPTAVTTAWNLSDPQRKAIYDDIKPYEKANNLIIIPDGATKDAQGRYNVIKIPIPPGLSNLAQIMRRTIEASQGMDPVKFTEVAGNIITAGTSVDITDPGKLAGSFTPQAVKPFLETSLNKNLYTGQDIVPSYMQNFPAEAQVRDNTPLADRVIGKVLNTSPLKVQNFISTTAGGLGNQLQGVEGPLSNLQRRFTKAAGGTGLDNFYTAYDKYQGLEKQVDTLVKTGKKQEALKILNDNKEAFQHGKVLKAANSRITKLNKIKKDLAISNVSPTQRQKLLKQVDDELKSIAKAVSEAVK